MTKAIEVRVPDIGDFKDVPVIEILVKAGDQVDVDTPLLTLESDKATMEVPSPQAGTVASIAVRVGDRISQGSLILNLAANGAPAVNGPARAARPPAPQAAPAITNGKAHASDGDAVVCDVAVMGGGPGGYSAAFRAADLGLKTVLIERYGTLGGVCLNVGCIPSKALLHVAAVMDEVRALARHGVMFGPATIDLAALHAHKSEVIRKLTNGLAGMAKARGVEVVRGEGRFVDAHHLGIDLTEGPGRARSGERRIISFGKCIIAAGSQAVRLPFLPDDPRIVDATGALALPMIPERMLVIGGGIIGLEMASVYAALGARIDIVEMQSHLMQGPDRDLVKIWEKKNSERFDALMRDTTVSEVTAKDDGIWVSFAGRNAPGGAQRYDFVLQAAGRSPNGGRLDAQNAGVAVDAGGFIRCDREMRTSVPHIFAIGDIAGGPMLAHKAVHEGHVAAETAAGLKSGFDATVIPAVAYTDPEVAWVGLGEDDAKRDGRKIEVARFPWTASGRAIANGREDGLTKLIFDAQSGRVIGGGIVGTHAGDLISEIALAIEMGADALDLAKTIHPHPTLSESVALAAEVHEGACTDLPPQRSKRAVPPADVIYGSGAGTLS